MVERRTALRLEELGLVLREGDFGQAMGTGVVRMEEGESGFGRDASMLEAREEGPLERGDLNMEMGEERTRANDGRTRSGVRGLAGLP